MSADEPVLAQVLTGIGSLYTVVLLADPDGPAYRCPVKGVLKKQGLEVVTGDRVQVDQIDPVNQTARIVAIEPRQSALARPKVANIDRVVIVHPLAEPDFDPEPLDRLLSLAALAGLPVRVILSKCDRATPEAIQHWVSLYGERLGIPVHPASIHQPETMTRLRTALTGETAVLAGLSGAGKSSLLNALEPGLNLRVGEVSARLLRGQHTTRHVTLLRLWEQTRVADAPGFSHMKFDTVLPDALERVIPEFAPFRGQCAFRDCLHQGEAGCAVQAALTEDPSFWAESRQASYQAMLTEALAYRDWVRESSQKEEGVSKCLQGKGGTSVQILRLPPKAREQSRRTRRQQSIREDLAEHTQDREP